MALRLFLVALPFFVLSILRSDVVVAQQNALCDVEHPCYVGCCSKSGVCGFTPNHCGEGNCVANCNATAECGQYAKQGAFDCPLNVCCSKHGFCGTTEEFCGDGCQKSSTGGGCGTPPRPTCSAGDSDPLKLRRRVAYYEIFTKGRSCGVKEPEELPLGPLTHVNLAFVNFGPDWKLIVDNPDWMRRMVLRKIKHPSLRVNIAVGGWAFNDPPTSTYFTTMASSRDSRATFVKSVVDTLRAYGLDGVDIDWEYPGAADRGGGLDDSKNYVQLLADLRTAFDREGSGWEISIAIPSSYWYMRDYSLERIQRQIDYFNLMSYDIYGMWDRDNKWTGPYLKGHTDWRKIDEGLDLLWRNNVTPDKVNMGFGFYGRSFTMANPNCIQPNGVCQFSDGGKAGSCSDTVGVLTYQEIASRNSTLDVATFYDPETTVKWNVFEGSQWVSYDDAQSFGEKLRRLAGRCLGGLMIWAIDQDTSDFKAMGELFGDYSGLELEGSSNESNEKLSELFGQFTGQQCFVTEKCINGDPVKPTPEQVCPPGTSSVDIAHNPLQRPGYKRDGDCPKGWWRHICCPKASMPHNCKWDGAPERNVFGCSGSCGKGTFELNRDTAIDAQGVGQCVQGQRKLCCQSTKLIDDCIWSSCQGPMLDNPTCPSGYAFLTYRHDSPDGAQCYQKYDDGKGAHPVHWRSFRSALCCPTERTFANCEWDNQPRDGLMGSPKYCLPQSCKPNQLQVARATTPPESTWLSGRFQNVCSSVSMPPGLDPLHNFCCDPPSTWNVDWPVDPERLWKEHFSNKNTDKALWEYSTQFEGNDKDTQRAQAGKIDGSDAFGFMMLNGAKQAIDDNFGTSHTVVRRSAVLPKLVKREILTNNHSLIDSVFEHAEEILHVYCNYPPGSAECEAVWDGGVQDTVVRLPGHVGEGPFARIVSMDRVGDEYTLPNHHITHRRDVPGIADNPIYRVKIDYNFHLVRQDRGPVKIRIDYTNLLGYWKQLTDSPPSRVKRGLGDDNEPFQMSHFRERVDRAEKEELELRKLRRRSDTASTFEVNKTVPFDLTPEEKKRMRRYGDVSAEGHHSKRWWGALLEWIKRLTTLTKSEVGDLPLDYTNTFEIFKASAGCPGRLYHATLKMDLELRMAMQATYAYYMSATFIPPTSRPDVFFYFGIEPNAYVGLTLEGDATLRMGTRRKKIIDTLGYPGLAVKGIVAVGPTLDVYGEIRGELNMHGRAKAGAELTFGKAQAYWPQGKDAEQYEKILGLDLTKSDRPLRPQLEPTFEAGVQVSAEIAVIVQPEANIGIKVGGGKMVGGVSLVDAQITGYLFGALTFRAWAAGDIVNSIYTYGYKASIFYNVGYNAKASILQWYDWALGERKAYSPDREFVIHTTTGKVELGVPTQAAAVVKRIPENLNATAAAHELFGRQAGGGGSGSGNGAAAGPGAPTFQNPISCPTGSQGKVTLPALRFNCGAFPPIEVEDAKNQIETLSGLCQGYQATSNTFPMTLTHSPTDGRYPFLKSRHSAKRRQQCRQLSTRSDTDFDTCPQETATLHGMILYRGSNMKLECDEFPWAGSEEGGNYFLPPAQRSQLCIPSVHNGLGGQCVKLLSRIEQNVGKMEPTVDITKRKDQWLSWADSGSSDLPFWWTDGQVLGPVTQRMSQYLANQPIPVGFTDANKPASPDLSWVFRRNYTFDMIDSGAQASKWWKDATAKRFKDGSNTFRNPNDFSSVICGINLWGQTGYYRGLDDANAWCYTNKRTAPGDWPDQFGFALCKVDFGTTQTKRDGGVEESDPADWKIEHVYDEKIDPDDPDPLGTLQAIRRRGREKAEREERRRLRRERRDARRESAQQPGGGDADPSSSDALAVPTVGSPALPRGLMDGAESARSSPANRDSMPAGGDPASTTVAQRGLMGLVVGGSVREGS